MEKPSPARAPQQPRHGPRGQSLPGTAEHPLQRKQVFAAALKRVNRDIHRMEKLEARTARIEAARRVLAMRRAAQFPPRPQASDTQSEGMHPLLSHGWGKTIWVIALIVFPLSRDIRVHNHSVEGYGRAKQPTGATGT